MPFEPTGYIDFEPLPTKHGDTEPGALDAPSFTLADVLQSVAKLLGHAHGYLDQIPEIDAESGMKASVMLSVVQYAILNARAAIGDAALGIETFPDADSRKRITDALLPDLGRFMDRLPAAVATLAERAQAEGVAIGKALARRDELAEMWNKIAGALPEPPELPGGGAGIGAALLAGGALLAGLYALSRR